jgi:oxaloacetate decarboxylase alpha subunit
MAGLLAPQTAYDLVKAIKSAVSVPVALHTHCTAGLGQMTQLMAMMAGVDILDCAISAFSGGTAQPATEAMHFAARSMGVETGLDETALHQINAYMKSLRREAEEAGMLHTDLLFADPAALRYQVPGGMLSNLSQQLKAQGVLDRLDAVLAEVPRVREDLGYPPLVTPSSQMVGAQAVTNVLLGKRYGSISKEIRAYLRGEYGMAPGPVSEELRRAALGEEAPITCRPADLLQPGLEAAARETAGLVQSPEELLSYIAYPGLMEPILREREERERNRCSYTIQRID